MKLIAFLVSQLDGGIGRNITNLAEAFTHKGYCVHIVLERDTGPYVDLVPADIPIHKLHTTHMLPGVPILAGYMRRHHPAIIITPNLRFTVLAVRARKLGRSSARIYARIHNTYSRHYASRDPKKLERRKKKMARFYAQCHGLVAVSQGVHRDFQEFVPISHPNFVTIYNPAVTPHISELAHERLEHAWFQAGQVPVILGIGRLTIQKNFPLLIKAFELVRAQQACRLVLVGDGEDFSVIKRLADSSLYHEDIELVGHQTNPFKYMKRADVFVLSSDWEGFGIVLAEAMATGTAVVATDCPSGPREILADGTYGKLVPVSQVEPLADAILDTLRHPPREALMLEGALRFSADRIAEAYLDFFEKTA